MAWWSENYPWVLAGAAFIALATMRRWLLKRLFSREPGAARRPAEYRSSAGEAGVVRRSGSDAVSGGVKLGIAALVGALLVLALLFGIAWWRGQSLTALPQHLVLAIAAPVALLWAIAAGLYLWARLAMRRQAERLAVAPGAVVSGYTKSLEMPGEVAEVLAWSRSAILSLPQGATVEDDDGDGDGEADEMVGRTTKSQRSFGEMVWVRVQKTGPGRVTVDIESRPALWQLFNGGINAENVAGVERYLQRQTEQVQLMPLPQVASPTSDPDRFTVADCLALGYLLAVAGYTAFLIVLLERWPDSYLAWVAWLDAAPLGALRLFGHACLDGQRIVSQLNILIFPTLIVYGAYNTAEFRSGRERMGLGNGAFCMASLVCLSLLVAVGCSIISVGPSSSKYDGLIAWVLRDSYGGALYALVLVIFTNGASYLPALVLARLLGPKSDL